jgi:hypothetical protein
MKKTALVDFIRRHPYAVQATVSPTTSPQAAVVGLAVSDDLEIVFDTVDTTRKLQNLRRNPAISLVVGGCAPGEEQTLQIDGIADEPTGPDLDRLRQVYYAQFPDGPSRLSWAGLVYVRIRPRWMRYSDFTKDPPVIEEIDPTRE